MTQYAQPAQVNVSKPKSNSKEFHAIVARFMQWMWTNKHCRISYKALASVIKTLTGRGIALQSIGNWLDGVTPKHLQALAVGVRSNVTRSYSDAAIAKWGQEVPKLGISLEQLYQTPVLVDATEFLEEFGRTIQQVPVPTIIPVDYDAEPEPAQPVSVMGYMSNIVLAPI